LRKALLFFKRIFDIFASGLALIFLLPVFAIIGILIKLDSKGPVFFIQTRAGRDGKPFGAYKLRSMVQDAEKKGLGFEIEQNDFRITVNK
jgi:lipopolysaccharide/colanic/teichoic acid biosynthesis glycosyltransferase